MKIIIHRGSRQIGGSCIEIQSGSDRIIIDYGLPLNYENNFSMIDLIADGILLNIKGLYENDNPTINAILLSHPHPDHYGLLEYINKEIPVFLSQGCKDILSISYFFNQTKYNIVNSKIIKPWSKFNINSFLIKSYLMDHSGFDSLAFEIRSENKSIFYTGDFRDHGRKNILFKNLLNNPPQNIDYLILEGTMLGRTNEKQKNEIDIENELINLFQKNELFLISYSSQNIDRFISVYKACVKSNKTLVIDPYTAYILDKLYEHNPGLPQNNWNNIKIFFVPNSYTKKLSVENQLFKYKDSKISIDEIIKSKNKLVPKSV